MNVTPQRLKEETEKGTAMSVIDLQDEHEYEHSHVPGAMNIPMVSFATAYAAVLKDKDETIVLYGEYDELGKGDQAAQTLEAAGYTKVGRLVGGLMGWKQAGYPIEGGQES